MGGTDVPGSGGSEGIGKGGRLGRMPERPEPSPWFPSDPLPGAEPQAAIGVDGSGVITRSWTVSSGDTSAGAGWPVSLHRVMEETSDGRDQSAGFFW